MYSGIHKERLQIPSAVPSKTVLGHEDAPERRMPRLVSKNRSSQIKNRILAAQSSDTDSGHGLKNYSGGGPQGVQAGRAVPRPDTQVRARALHTGFTDGRLQPPPPCGGAAGA